MDITKLKTILCPKCGWHGNDYDCGRLTVREMQTIGIADEHGFLLPRYKSWNLRYCPECLYTRLLLINQKEYDKAINPNVKISIEDQQWLDRTKKC